MARTISAGRAGSSAAKAAELFQRSGAIELPMISAGSSADSMDVEISSTFEN